MIKLKDVNKKYGDNCVVDNVSLELAENQFITLLGKNGAGKSTLLRLIAGLELPDAGIVSYKDYPLESFDFPFISEIGFVHEGLDYQLPISFKEFVDKVKVELKNWDQSFFDEMVEHQQFDLSKRFQQYSRGQKMQLALMLNLAMRPKLLLLDEITSVIDVYGRKYFLDLLRNYVDEGNTVIVTTNIINELEFYSDRLLIIKDGHIQLNSEISGISKKFTKLRKKIDESHEVFSHEKCLWAGVNSDKSISYIMETEILNQFQIGDDLLDRRSSTLEDIFLYFYSDKEGDDA